MGMITFVKGGDIFNYQTPGVLLVNPVNTEGVSGCGLAKAFRERFPDMFKAYRAACDPNFTGIRLDVGRLLFLQVAAPQDPFEEMTICCFPTKKEWRYPSQLSYIEQGLEKLAEFLTNCGGAYRKVVIPMLGCGAGGLPREEVIPLFTKYLGTINDKEIIVLT